MSAETVIEQLDKMAQHHEICGQTFALEFPREKYQVWGQTLREAISLLRTHPDAQPNEPLTEVEVEEYEGKPLWFERPSLNHCSGGKWEIVDGVNTYDHVIILRGGKIVRGYGLDAVAYRRPPKEV